MKGISFITDNKNKKKAIIIELKELHEHTQEIYDVIDVLVAESRREDESVDLETAKKHLRKKGRL